MFFMDEHNINIISKVSIDNDKLELFSILFKELSHLALNDIIHNFDEIQDKPLLDLLMMIDKLCIDLGETHYAIALAFK